ncbi:MAG TPA: 50S ribosomal protein L25/general stress protein Ctc [Microbacteriaceae bacterium]|nr:50S ribosomal protein L25/general stress protein Ctc [Microbacteriaceae bacterium]
MNAELSNRIQAEARASFGKGAARRIRAAGKIPAVVYGHGTAPRHVTLPGHQVTLLLRKANQVLELTVESDEVLALVKDVQRDPVRQIIEHIDLLVVKKGERVHVEVPAHIEGIPAPSTTVLQDAVTLRLDVEATKIPERVIIDITGFEAGTHVTAADVPLPEGAILLDDPELLMLTVSDKTVTAEPEAEETAAAEAPVEETAAEDAPAE